MPPSAPCVCVVPTITTAAPLSIGGTGGSVTSIPISPTPSTYHAVATSVPGRSPHPAWTDAQLPPKGHSHAAVPPALQCAGYSQCSTRRKSDSRQPPHPHASRHIPSDTHARIIGSPFRTLLRITPPECARRGSVDMPRLDLACCPSSSAPSVRHPYYSSRYSRFYPAVYSHSPPPRLTPHHPYLKNAPRSPAQTSPHFHRPLPRFFPDVAIDRDTHTTRQFASSGPPSA